MYRLEITVVNPLNREQRTLVRQFDENLSAAVLGPKWNALAGPIKALIDDIVATTTADPAIPVM